MKSVIRANGKKKSLYPFMVYCNRSIKLSLQELLNREGFIELLQQGPNFAEEGYFSDICDGNVYKTFLDIDGTLYFSDKRNLGALINLDWFNPYENQEYSVGALYMVLVNLPREVRFKWENVIVLGILPGPKESKHVNTYLEPHIEELQETWNDGFILKENGKDSFYKLAIICTSNDVPATRQLCGFKAHNALKGTFIVFGTLRFGLKSTLLVCINFIED